MSLYFPMFVDLSEKNVLFIGGGRITVRRMISIYEFAGSVTVVSPEAEPEIIKLADAGYIRYIRKIRIGVIVGDSANREVAVRSIF